MNETGAAAHAQPMRDLDLLLHETNHRCSNDLQMVVGLLALQSRRACSDEARDALADAMRRVSVLADARTATWQGSSLCLEAALDRVCEALQAQAEPRSIAVSLATRQEVDGLSDKQVTTLALVANELATNAIKHAFGEGRSGRVVMSIVRDERAVTVIVDDDGLPFRPDAAANGGMGIDLVSRLMASVGGVLARPDPGSKAFELRIPVMA